MKNLPHLLALSFLVLACQPEPKENPAKAVFDKNCQTVADYLDAFCKEDLDHRAFFAEEYWSIPTYYGNQDTLFLEDIISGDQEMFKIFDFEVVDELNLLPGVNAETKEMDGSVRHYNRLKLIIPGTDSSEAVEMVFPFYESYDFDENGKILFYQAYGDWGGVDKYIESLVEEAMEEEGQE